MKNIELLMWIAFYLTLATILFNLLRYLLRLNLPSSFLLCISISILLSGLIIGESMQKFISDYIFPFSILAVTSGTCVAIVRYDTEVDKKANY